MELANCLLECYTTDSLKPAEARSEEGEIEKEETRHLLAQGWPPTNTHGQEEKGIRAEGSVFFFMSSAAIQDCDSQRQ